MVVTGAIPIDRIILFWGVVVLIGCVVGAREAYCVVGPGGAEDWELRAFFPVNGATVEDPVTGSLNASVAGWLLETGRATVPYTAAQGTALGRAGRIHVSTDADGTLWVGGGTVTCISGEVAL